MDTLIPTDDIVISVKTLNILIRIPRRSLPDPPKHVYIHTSRRRYRATKVDATRNYAYYAARVEIDDVYEILDSPRIAGAER